MVTDMSRLLGSKKKKKQKRKKYLLLNKSDVKMKEIKSKMILSTIKQILLSTLVFVKK